MEKGRQGAGQTVPEGLVLCVVCGWMRCSDYALHLDEAIAAHDKQVRQEERERIAQAIDDLEHDSEEARRLVRTGEQEVAWVDGYAQAVFDSAHIARQGGSE